MQKSTKILLVILILIVLVPLTVFAAVKLPADYQYNKTFGSHVIIAEDSATFEGVRAQVIIIWSQMNKTFAGFDFNNTFNSPWYWEQTYDNSLAAQTNYFGQIVRRVDSYVKQWQIIQNSTSSSVLQDWYDLSIRNLRDEMTRGGDLDWALKGAWYLNFAPAAYWAGVFLSWMVPLGILTFIIALAVFISIASRRSREKQLEEREARKTARSKGNSTVSEAKGRSPT